MSDYPTLKMLINGEWIAAGEAGTMEVVNPATGAVIGHCPKASPAQLDAALKAVHPPHRCDVRVLEALADRLPAERDDEAFALLQRCFEHAMAGAKSPYAEPLRLVARAMLRLNSQQAKAFVLSLGQAHRAKRNFIAGLPPVRGP